MQPNPGPKSPLTTRETYHSDNRYRPNRPTVPWLIADILFPPRPNHYPAPQKLAIEDWDPKCPYYLEPGFEQPINARVFAWNDNALEEVHDDILIDWYLRDEWFCERCYLYALHIRAPPLLQLGDQDPVNGIVPGPIPANTPICPLCKALRNTWHWNGHYVLNGNVRGVGPLSRQGMWKCYECLRDGRHERLPLKESQCPSHAHVTYMPSFDRFATPAQIGGLAIMPIPGWKTYLCSHCSSPERCSSVGYTQNSSSACPHCRRHCPQSDGYDFHMDWVAIDAYYIERLRQLQDHTLTPGVRYTRKPTLQAERPQYYLHEYKMLYIEETKCLEPWYCERCYLFTLDDSIPDGPMAQRFVPGPITGSELFCPICQYARHTGRPDGRTVTVNGNVRGHGLITMKGQWRCFPCAKNGIDCVMDLAKYQCNTCGRKYEPGFGTFYPPSLAGGCPLVPVKEMLQFLCCDCLRIGGPISAVSTNGMSCENCSGFLQNNALPFVSEKDAWNYYATRARKLERCSEADLPRVLQELSADAVTH